MFHVSSAASAILLAWLLGTPAAALEKAARRAIDSNDSWNASSSETLRYYNNCTGWVWVWSGWSPGVTVGTNFDDRTTDKAYLNTSWTLTFSGIPSGYGFTGTLEVRGGHNCSAPVLASQPYLPPVTSGWSAQNWGGLPVRRQFSLLVVWGADTGFTNGTGLASDHPFAGPTGPQSCGTCFPLNRLSNSRYYGVDGAYCPSGTVLNDGVCDIEWMIEANVYVPLPCGNCVSVEQESWGHVKALYR